jgi:hypothetical protein
MNNGDCIRERERKREKEREVRRLECGVAALKEIGVGMAFKTLGYRSRKTG